MELQTNLLAAYASAGRSRDVDETSIPVRSRCELSAMLASTFINSDRLDLLWRLLDR